MAAPAVSYEVRWREAGSNTAWRSQRFPANSTVITIPGLTRGKTYEGDARSIGAQGETSLWVPVTFSIGMPTYVPKPPIDMVVLPAPNGVNLSWEIDEGNRPDTVYVIERKPPGGEWEQVGQTTGSTIYIPVEDDQLYEWRVYAKDWQEMVSQFTDAIGRARERVASNEELAQETLDRIQGDADEAAARAAGDAAEALARSEALLDLHTELSAEIANETVLRESADENLASQIANISAGSGEQFDSDFIWYFDTTPEGWTAAVSGSAPTAGGGFMRPADNSVPGGVQSPVFDGTGNTYRTVKMRLKQTGSPTWQGYVWWQTDADATYTTDKRVSLPEPVFDPSGVATMDFKDIPWAVDVNRIRVDLTSTQDASNYIEFDWIAVGRPSPGASMAALQEETTARITADQAEATARQNLASQMRGNYTGTDLALVTTGLIASEKTARTDADEAEATSREALSVKVTGLADPSGATLPTLTSGLIYDERTARANEDEALAEDITALDVRLDAAEGNISLNASGLSSLTTRVTTAEDEIVAQGTAIDDLSARVTDTENGLSGAGDAINALDVRVTATEDSIEAQATQITGLTATSAWLDEAVNDLPGDNVLQNSSFDGEEMPIAAGVRPKFWSPQLGGTGTGTGFAVSLVASTLQGSTKALRMEASSLATTRYMEMPVNTGEVGERYKITPGKKHTLTAWIRGSVGNNIQIFIQYFNAGGAVVATRTLPMTPVTADFARYAITGDAAPTDAFTATVYAVRMYGRTGEPAAWVEVDNVQFQQGAVGTNYMPSISLLSSATATALQQLDTRTTANEDEITAQALAITSLQASTNTRGVNLLPDKYSYFDPAAAAPTLSGVSGGTAARSTEQAYVSNASIKMVSSTTDNNFTFGNGSQYEISLLPGKKYLLSLYQYSSLANAQLQYQISAANGNSRGPTNFPAIVLASNTWGRNAVIIDLTTSGGAAVTATAWKLRIDNAASSGVTTYIDGVMIEELVGTGTTPSAYSRGDTGTQQVATANAVQSIDARVTTVEGQTTANSTSITTLTSQVNGLSAPGINLAQNPSGEFGKKDWFTTLTDFSVSTNGALGPHLWAVNPAAGTVYYTECDGRAGSSYSVGCDMEINGGTSYVFNVDFLNGTSFISRSPSVTVLPSETPVNGTFIRKTLNNIVAPAGTTRLRFRMEVNGVPVHVRWRKLKIEEGTVATAYTADQAAANTAVATVALETNASTKPNGGINMYPNSSFAVDMAPGHVIIWNGAGGSVSLYRTNGSSDAGFPIRSAGIIITSTGGTEGGTVLGGMSTWLPGDFIEGNAWYIFSAYLSGGQSGLWLQWLDQNNTVLREDYGPFTTVAAGGRKIAVDWTRVYLRVQAPANAVRVRTGFTCRAWSGGFTFTRVLQPMFEKVPDYQTAPSAYGQGGVETFAAFTVALDVNGYASGFQSYNNGTQSSFNILASNFAIINPAGGARTEYSGGNWRVYDAGGVLRVRMGVW